MKQTRTPPGISGHLFRVAGKVCPNLPVIARSEPLTRDRGKSGFQTHAVPPGDAALSRLPVPDRAYRDAQPVSKGCTPTGKPTGFVDRVLVEFRLVRVAHLTKITHDVLIFKHHVLTHNVLNAG